MKAIHTFRMSGQTLLSIDEYEKKHFSKPAKLFERCVQLMPHGQQQQLDFIMASSMDKTVAVIFTVDGVQGKRDLAITDPGSLGDLLFRHALTTAVITGALEAQYGFAYCYFYAQKISNSIVPGDADTYPQYIEQLTPAEFGENEDYEFNVFRFTMVGESRVKEFTTAFRAVVRYAVLPSDEGISSNFNEVFPVLQLGPYITFNGYVPFPAQIVGPLNDNSILPIAEDRDLYNSKAVMLVSEDRFNISIQAGINDHAIAVTEKMALR